MAISFQQKRKQIVCYSTSPKNSLKSFTNRWHCSKYQGKRNCPSQTNILFLLSRRYTPHFRIESFNLPKLAMHQVRCGQRLYGEAAAELASNLTELQRGRIPDQRILDKPYRNQTGSTLLYRKEPHLPRATPLSSLVIKPSPQYSNDSLTDIIKQD